jgi:hypothetical protein
MWKTPKNLKSKSISALRVTFVTAVAMLVAAPLFAQSTTTYTEYAASFTCGVINPGSTSIAPADYYTTINVHNPNLFTSDSPISFLKKAVLAHSEGITPTAPSAFKQDSLSNDYAEVITCNTIRNLLGSAAPSAPGFIEGYVVIVVPPASSPINWT